MLYVAINDVSGILNTSTSKRSPKANKLKHSIHNNVTPKYDDNCNTIDAAVPLNDEYEMSDISFDEGVDGTDMEVDPDWIEGDEEKVSVIAMQYDSMTD
jgi:hypothetical protein